MDPLYRGKVGAFDMLFIWPALEAAKSQSVLPGSLLLANRACGVCHSYRYLHWARCILPPCRTRRVGIRVLTGYAESAHAAIWFNSAKRRGPTDIQIWSGLSAQCCIMCELHGSDTSLNHRVTECLGLEGTSVGRLIQPPAEAGSARAGCTGSCPGGAWISPEKENPQSSWATCSSAPSLNTFLLCCRLPGVCFGLIYIYLGTLLLCSSILLFCQCYQLLWFYDTLSGIYCFHFVFLKVLFFNVLLCKWLNFPFERKCSLLTWGNIWKFSSTKQQSS